MGRGLSERVVRDINSALTNVSNAAPARKQRRNTTVYHCASMNDERFGRTHLPGTFGTSGKTSRRPACAGLPWSACTFWRSGRRTRATDWRLRTRSPRVRRADDRTLFRAPKPRATTRTTRVRRGTDGREPEKSEERTSRRQLLPLRRVGRFHDDPSSPPIWRRVAHGYGAFDPACFPRLLLNSRAERAVVVFVSNVVVAVRKYVRCCGTGLLTVVASDNDPR